MFTLFVSLLFSVPACFRTRAALQAEILALCHQILALQRSSRGHKLRLCSADRVLWVWLSRLWTEWRSALIIVKPQTVIGWHRQGFRLYWRWKSRHPSGRPSASSEVADLIRRMSLANPRSGAPRIHGELLKVGISISQATVAKYMPRHRKPPSQNWRTFLENHMQNLVSTDFFVVPTITFRLLFVFVIRQPPLPAESRFKRPWLLESQRCPVPHFGHLTFNAREKILLFSGFIQVVPSSCQDQ